MLERFLERHAARAGRRELAAFDELLEMPDNDLWDLVMGGPQRSR